MDRKSQAIEILTRISNTLEELLENESTDGMSIEELVTIAVEMNTSMPVTNTVEYTQPIGRVDRERVTVMLGDDFEFPLFGDTYYEED